ncbi:MAG TPA: gfo/Idh/MocA family oxidoreductase [Pirellulales bacterium]|nr:gfo/Idh/MocA family oxidoreductase [Pirellulales bacterium]
MSVKNGPIKLVAMADVFKDRLDGSYASTKKRFGDRVDVPEDRQFIGFDAYQKAMDVLKPGDVAIFATPPAFRWVHFTYAIEKGLNVFMEKPVTVDGPTSRKMFKLAEEATAKNLKVGVGLMSRHSRAMQQLADRIHGGEIGDLILMRGYRMHGPVGSMRSLPKPAGVSEVEYQVRKFHSFLWASGGCFSDFYIHIIDHSCWMKNAWPVQAQAIGGRHYRGDYIDQNFDTYGVEYTFPDETKFTMDGRCIDGCSEIYHSFAHGTKGTAEISHSGDCGAPSATFKGLGSLRADMLWESKLGPDEGNPYQNEWNDLVDAIRNNKPYNEVKRGVETSLVTSMGRMAAHTGRIVTYDQILNSKHEFAPSVDKLTMNGAAPLVADAKGKYPVPQPGIVTQQEY